jgi:hypothetical protein
MRGALISDVMVAGDQIAIQTSGAACGDTITVFFIGDPDLRERTVRALRQGADVHEAVAATL